MIVDEVQNMRYYLLSIVLTLSIHVAAQTKVSGTVYDQDNQPVAFANVLFKNSSEGVISDFDGNFLLQSENNHSAIVVSFVGFETAEFKLKTKTSTGLKIVLQTGFELDEVLIVNKPKKRLKKKERSDKGSLIKIMHSSTLSSIPWK